MAVRVMLADQFSGSINAAMHVIESEWGHIPIEEEIDVWSWCEWWPPRLPGAMQGTTMLSVVVVHALAGVSVVCVGGRLHGIVERSKAHEIVLRRSVQRPLTAPFNRST
jgi:hypothetical protein